MYEYKLNGTQIDENTDNPSELPLQIEEPQLEDDLEEDDEDGDEEEDDDMFDDDEEDDDTGIVGVEDPEDQ